jgi:hypothetical protein
MLLLQQGDLCYGHREDGWAIGIYMGDSNNQFSSEYNLYNVYFIDIGCLQDVYHVCHPDDNRLVGARTANKESFIYLIKKREERN